MVSARTVAMVTRTDGQRRSRLDEAVS